VIALVIEQRRLGLGGVMEVGRVLRSATPRMVGPFNFFDHIGLLDLAPGVSQAAPRGLLLAQRRTRCSSTYTSTCRRDECIAAFSETDFTEDLKRSDVPTLILHGGDDQIVPIDAAARASAKLIKGSKLVVYPGAPHGLPDTHKDELNADLLAFVKSIDA
jgi:pimeloyl-ACP methyl ester carboxylesterase